MDNSPPPPPPHHFGTECNSRRHWGKTLSHKKLLGVFWNSPNLAFELGSEGEAEKTNKRASHFTSGLWGDAAEIPVREQGEEIS